MSDNAWGPLQRQLRSYKFSETLEAHEITLYESLEERLWDSIWDQVHYPLEDRGLSLVRNQVDSSRE